MKGHDMSFETPGPVEARLRDAISPIEEIIEEAQQTQHCLRDDI